MRALILLLLHLASSLASYPNLLHVGDRLYSDDDFVVAIATDSPHDMPEATLRPVLDLNDPYAITEWLVANEDRFEYNPPLL